MLVDPARNPQPYYDFAQANDAKIVAVIETHPHADFVSSHAEIARATGAAVRVSKLLGAGYPHPACYLSSFFLSSLRACFATHG